jgi:hypothetical protein
MKGKWVLILDNLDNTSFLIDAQRTREVSQMNVINCGNLLQLVLDLLQCQNRSALITTRSKNTALKLVKPRNIIAIEPMSQIDTLALFKNKLGGHNDSDDTAQLVAELKFMPLAIVQAAAYISELGPRCSVRQYLQMFQKSNSKRSSLLEYKAKELQQDSDAKNSIIIT